MHPLSSGRIGLSELNELFLFPPRDCISGWSEAVLPSGLDLDKDEGAPVPSHDVDFSMSRPCAAFENEVSATLELSAS